MKHCTPLGESEEGMVPASASCFPESSFKDREDMLVHSPSNKCFFQPQHELERRGRAINPAL